MNTYKVTFCLLLTIILWSSAFVGIRFGLHGYTAGEIAFFRYFVASIVMLFLYLRLPVRSKVPLRQLPYIIIMGVIGIGIYNIMLNLGEVGVSAGVASFIIGLMPVITMILAVIFLREQITFSGWLGVLVSLLGMLIIALNDLGHSQKLINIFEVFLAALCGSIFAVMQKKLFDYFSPIELTAFSIWAGTVFMLPYAPGVIDHIPTAPWLVTADIIYMGIFPGAIAYACWSYALSVYPASRAIVYLYLLPLLSTCMGYILLRERPSTFALLGGVIALLGAVIVQTVRRRQL